MPQAEVFSAKGDMHEGTASRALYRLHQVGRAVLGVFDLASPYYDRIMDKVLQPGQSARKRDADNIIWRERHDR